MSSRTSDSMKRYFVHALMLFFGFVAIIPIYVLLINATRTTEQINTGFTIYPGLDAFFSSTDTIIVNWDETVKITPEEGASAEEAPAEEQAGEQDVEQKPVIEITAGDMGMVKYLDMIMGATLKEEKNEKTGDIETRVVKALTESRQPRIAIVNEDGYVLASYNLSNNALVFVQEGQWIKRGETIARTVKPSNVVYNWRALTGRGFQIWQGFGNSAFIAIFATVLSIYFSALTAYGLHVYRFKGRAAIWVIILVIMMLPGSLTFIGFYQLMAQWKLTNTYIPLILPGIAAAATVLFIRQYMSSVLSLELIDAARIDGAGEYHIFNRIILPVIIPALAAQAIFTFVGSWNNYLTPAIIISSQEKATLPMLIMSLRGDIYRTEFGGIYLGIAVSLLPIIIFYSFMSRFIISGITMGGIKE